MPIFYLKSNYFLNPIGDIYIYPISTTLVKNLTCQLNPITFRAVDMLPQTIKIRVSLHCLLRQSNREENQMSGNPLFISILSSPISPPLSSTLHTPREKYAETYPPAEFL